MILFERYEYQPSDGPIGKTRLSLVYKAIDNTTSIPVAIKIFRNNESADGIALPEDNTLLTLEHPNLCRYWKIGEIERESPFGEKESMLVCVREYVNGKNLTDWYQSHKDPELLKPVVADFLRGLQYLDGQGIIHGRIKATNLLVSTEGGTPRGQLSDFGLKRKDDSNIEVNTDLQLLHQIIDNLLPSTDDTQVLILPSNTDDTEILPVNADDTQILVLPSNTDDTQILPVAADDTEVLLPDTNDTVILPVAANDRQDPAPANNRRVPPPVPPPPSSRGDTVHLLLNRYEYTPRVDLIGKGGFSKVYKAFDRRLNRWVALKIYTPGDFSDQYSPIAEIRRVINLDHPNICRYIDIEEIEREDALKDREIIQICVMELLDGGTLAEYYKSNPSEEVLRKLLSDVLNGLAYLHRNGIIHRDIKPANILIRETADGPVAKITDFGISKLSDATSRQNFSAIVGSVPYMAPEQLNVRKYGARQGVSFNLDLWSLGVTIYEVITGNPLFKNGQQESSEQIMANILAGAPAEKIAELPQPFRDIVTSCVVMDARDRVQKAGELLPLLHRTAQSAPVVDQPPAKPVAPTPPPPPPEKITRPKKAVASGEAKQIDRRIIWLGIAIAIAVLFLGVSVWLYIHNRQTPDVAGLSAQKADSTILTPPAATTPTVVKTTPNSDPTSPQPADSSAYRHKRAHHTPTQPAEDLSAGRDNRSSKCMLKLSASESCDVTIMGITSRIMQGESRTYRLGLGDYIIHAKAIDNPNLKYDGKLTVKPEMLDQPVHFNMTLTQK